MRIPDARHLGPADQKKSAPDNTGTKRERDHKPGSVLDGHLSRPYVTVWLKRLRRTRRAAVMPPLHLAPGGVYSGNRLPGFRVSSYLAFPSLPPGGGGLFLLHFPWSRLHRPLTGALALWRPDFPHASRHATVCSPRTRLSYLRHPHFVNAFRCRNPQKSVDSPESPCYNQ